MKRVLAVFAVIALIVVGAWAYTRPAAPVAAPSPSPAVTASAAPTPTAVVSPTATASPSATPTGTPIPYGPAVVLGDVTVRGAVADPPGPDFRYVVTGQGTGTTFWVVLLDLGAKRARTVAQVDVVVPSGSQAGPSLTIHPTAPGDRLLIVATEPAGRTQVFMLDVERAIARGLGTIPDHSQAVLSPDGSRFAFNDRGSDPERNGVWIGMTTDGSSRRLIADDPQRPSSPPIPQSFSPDGRLLAVNVGLGGIDGQDVVAIVETDAPESRVDARAGTVGDATILSPGGVVDWRGAPGNVWVWQGRSLHSGANVINSFDLATGRRTPVYAPAGDMALRHVARHPALDSFATVEDDGFGDAGAVWIRTLQGQATKVTDTTETGPHSPWWSPDGSRLYAFQGGDDSVGAVGDLLHPGEGAVTYCLREATGRWDCV